jgi:hypothetical protein
MTPVLSGRALSFGVLSWCIPFAVSFAFVDAQGQLALPQPLFKSLMVVISGAVGAGLLVLAFRRLAPTVGHAAALGGLWMLLNLGLDVAVLVPIMQVSVREYWQDIGLRYLLMPIMAVSMAVVARQSRPGVADAS